MSRVQNGAKLPTPGQEVVPSSVTDHPSSEHRQEESSDRDLLFDPTYDVPIPDFGDLPKEIFDPDIDFADFLSPQATAESAWYDPLEASSPARHSSPSTGQAQRAQGANCSPHLSLQSLPTYHLRSFNHRTRMNTGAQRTSNLILHTLKSYPMMLRRDNTLPPFVHPHLVSNEVQNNDMEPLTNCINLVHMLSSRFHGTRKLFWKNVRMECESLYASV